MELKKRSKTVIDFQRAKSGTIVRLKSLTKFNGVLQNIDFTSVKQKKSTSEKCLQKEKSQNKNILKKQASKLPVVRKPLKLNNFRQIIKAIPTQGYLEFEINQKKNNENICSTVSTNGAIISLKNSIQFWSTKELQKRSINFEKLKDIQTIKYLSVLKPFLKWKKYTKIRRFTLLQQNLKSRINVSIMQQKNVIHGKLSEYLQKRKYDYLQFILCDSKILNKEKQIKKPELLKILINSLQKSYDCMVIQQDKKNTFSLQTDLKVLIKLSLFTYRQVCQQYSIRMSQLIKERISKQFNQNRYNEKQYREIIKGNKQKQVSIMSTKIILEEDKNGQIVGKMGDSIFNPYLRPIKTINLEEKIFQTIRNLKNQTRDISKSKNKIIWELIQNHKLNWIPSNQMMSKSFQKLKNTLIIISEQSNRDFKSFVNTLKSEIETIQKIDLGAANRIIQVKQRLNKIESMPDQIYFGLLTINIKKLKMNLKKKIGVYWQESCVKLPKDIDLLFSKIEHQANEMQSKIEAGTWAIPDIVIAWTENLKFSTWKQTNNHRIRDIQSMLEMNSKINPRISQGLAVRYIQFKQRMKSIMVKSQAFQRSLPERLRLASSQKKQIIQKVQRQLKQFSKSINHIRKTHISEQIAGSLHAKIQQFENKIKYDLKHLIKFTLIQNNMCQGKQTQYLNKINNSYQENQKQILFYILQIEAQTKIIKQVQSFITEWENEKVVDVPHPHKLTEMMKLQIKKINRNCQQLNILINPLIESIIQKYKQQIQFFKALQILRRSYYLQNDSSKQIKKTIKQFHENKLHIPIMQQLLQAEQKLNIIQRFAVVQKQMQLKLEEHKILHSYQLTLKQGQFNSVTQGIAILNESVQMQNNKIKNICSCFDQNWKQYLKDDYAKTLQNLKDKEKAIQSLIKLNQLAKIHFKNKNLQRVSFIVQNEEKLKKKWILLFNQFQQCSLLELINKIRHFQNNLKQIQQIQVQLQQKIQTLLTRAYSSFPLLYMYDKNIAMKSIFNPQFFVTYFFQDFNVKYEDECFKIKSNFYENINISMKTNELSLKSFFSQVQKQIRREMIELHQSITKSNNYNFMMLLQLKCKGTPLQIISFLDMMQMGRENKERQKICQQIQELTKNMSGLNKRCRNDEQVSYRSQALSMMLLNRIEVRDLCALHNSHTFKPSYDFQEEDSNFYFQMCNFRIKLCYHLISSTKNSPLTTNYELYMIATLHQSFDNPECTVVLQDPSWLGSYSYRVMKYLLSFPLLSNRFRLIIFAALKAKVILNLYHKCDLKHQVLQKVHNQLFNFYHQKKSKINNWHRKNIEWPIFVTLPQMQANKYQLIKPQIRAFFRSLSSVAPQINSILELVIRKHCESSFSNMVKLIPSIQGSIKNNRYAQVKRIILKFAKIYNGACSSKLQPFMNSKLLQKCITKVINQTQIIANRTKLTYSKFIKIIKWYLICHLNGVNRNNNDKNLRIDQIKTAFQIKSITSIKNLQTPNCQNVSSIKIIQNQILQKNEQKMEVKQYDYYLAKADQLKQILKGNNMVAIIGSIYSGKSYFLSKYLQSCSGYPQNIVRLHHSALGQQIWEEQFSIFNNKKFHHHKTHYIFDGDLHSSNYHMFEKMLKSKCLFYRSGQSVSISSNSKIIFEVQNSDNIDPFILVEMPWINLTQSQLKWKFVLQNKIEEYKIQLIQSKKSQNRDNLTKFQIYVKSLLNIVVSQLQGLLCQIFENEFTQPFCQITNYNNFIILLFKKMRIFSNQMSEILDNNFASNQNLLLSSKNIILLILYCLYSSIRLGYYKQKNRLIQKIKSVISKKIQINIQKIDEMFPKIQNKNGLKGLKYQIIQFQNYPYYLLSSSLLFIPDYKQIVRSYLIDKMIEKKENILVIGKQCTGKSRLVKNLKNCKTAERIRLNLKGSYEDMLQKIKYKNNLKSSLGLQKMSNDQIITIFVEDCSYQEKAIVQKLKYLWECKSFLHQNTLKIEKDLNFIIEWNQLNDIPPQFIHLNHIQTNEQVFPQSIYNHLITSSNQYGKNQIAFIDSSQHSQLSSILSLIKNLKIIFCPSRLQDWKHQYGNWIVNKAIQIYYKHKNWDTLFKQHKILDQYINDSEDDSSVLKKIRIIVIQILSLRMRTQEKIMFDKFASKINNSLEGIHLQQHYQKFKAGLQRGQLSRQQMKLLKKTNNNSNSRKIKFAVEFANFIIIQRQFYLKQQTCLALLNQIENSKVIQMSNVFLQFKNLMFFITENHKKYQSDSNNMKIIYYFSFQYLKIRGFQILQYLNQICYKQKNQSTLIQSLANSVFIIQNCYKNVQLLSKILDLKCLFRQSFIISFEEQVHPQSIRQIQQEFQTAFKQQTHSIPNANQIIEKAYLIFLNLRNKLSSKKNTTQKIIGQNQNMEQIFQPQMHLKQLKWENIKIYIKQIIRIYSKKAKKLNDKQTLNNVTIKQLQKLIQEYNQKLNKTRQVSVNVFKKEIELSKIREQNAKVKQDYDRENQKLKINEQVKLSSKQKRKIEEIDPNQQRFKLKRLFRLSLASINRTEVSELKYVFSNSKDLYADLFDCICLTLNGDADPNSIYKILMDVNLTNKIRQCKFRNRSTQCLQTIVHKTKESLLKMEEKHILRHIVQWMFYGASLQIHIRSLTKQKQSSERHSTQFQPKQLQQLIQQQIRLQQVLLQIQNQQQKMCLLEQQLTELKKQLNHLKNLISKFQNFQQFQQIKNLCLQEIFKIQEERKKLVPQIIYNVFSFYLLPSLSLSDLVGMKKLIYWSISQNFEHFEPKQHDINIWSSLYQINNLNKKQKDIAYQKETKQSIIEQVKSTKPRCFKLQRGEDYIPTNHQVMKLYSFLKAIRQKKNIIVINRAQNFSKVIQYHAGSLKPKIQSQSFDQFFLQAIQIHQEEWKTVQQQIIQQNITSAKVKSKFYSNIDKFSFLISNSLGILDQRFCKNSYLLEHFHIFDFGIDSQDIKQNINQQIKYFIHKRNANKNININFKNFELTRQKLYYQFVEKIKNQLQNTYFDQSQKINDLIYHIKKWKQQYVFLNSYYQYPNSSPQNDKKRLLFTQKIFQIFLAYQQSFNICIKQSNNAKMKILNLPQNFINILSRVLKQALTLESKQISLHFQHIRKILLANLLETAIGQNFKIIYFSKIHSKQIDPNITQKDIINLFHLSPLQTRMKKLLNYKGIDIQYFQIEQLPLKNTKLQAQTKKILDMIKNSDKFLMNSANKVVDSQVLRQVIFNIKDINLIEKLILTKVFIYNAFFRIVGQQIQKVMKMFLITPMQYARNSIINTSLPNLYICLCNLNFWKIYLPATEQENSTKSLIENQKEFQFYFFNSARKLEEYFIYGKKTKIILIDQSKGQEYNLTNELNLKKISYQFISIQKMLCTCWSQLVKINEDHKMWCNWIGDENQKAYVQRYLCYKNIQKTINKINFNYKQENQTNSIYESSPHFEQDNCQQYSDDIQDDGKMNQFSTKNAKSMLFLEKINEHKNNSKYQKESTIIKQDRNIAKNIYLQLKKIQQVPYFYNQVKIDRFHYIKQFFQSLESFNNNKLNINHAKFVVEELKSKLQQIYNKNNDPMPKTRKFLWQEIQNLYKLLKKLYFSSNLTHKDSILKSKQTQIQKNICQIYQKLIQFCMCKLETAVQQKNYEKTQILQINTTKKQISF